MPKLSFFILLFIALAGARAAPARPHTTAVAAPSTREVFVRSDPIIAADFPNGNHPLVERAGEFVRVDWTELLEAVAGRLAVGGKVPSLRAALLVNGEVVANDPNLTSAFVTDTPGQQQDYYVEFRDERGVLVHRSDLVLKESPNAQLVPAAAFRKQSTEQAFSVELPASVRAQGVTAKLTDTAIRLGYEKIVWVLAPGASPSVRALVRAHAGDLDVSPRLDADGAAESVSIRQISTGAWLARNLSPNQFYFKVDAAFNGNCFFWDDMFVSLAMVPHHPWLARSTVEFWLDVQRMNGGVIPREVRKSNLRSLWFPETVRAGLPTVPNLEYTNPYLLHWVASELYRWDPSASNRELLRRVADSAEVYAHWLEENRAFRNERGDVLGFVTNGLGSGGDDSRGGRGNDHAPTSFRSGWVDLLAQTSDLWKSVARFRELIGESRGVAEARVAAMRYDHLLAELYWDPKRKFYFDLVTNTAGTIGRDLDFESIFGFWPLISGSAGPAQVRALAEMASDARQFGGSFPLPANSRARIPTDDPDEDGYWGKWSHWPSMVSAVIDGFAENGHRELATRLTINFLRGMAQASTYTVYEFYGESFDGKTGGMSARAGQHRSHVTRADFAGWGKVPPVRDLLAHVAGFRPDREGRLVWRVVVPLADGEEIVLRNLVIGGIRRPILRLTRTAGRDVVSGSPDLDIRVEHAK